MAGVVGELKEIEEGKSNVEVRPITEVAIVKEEEKQEYPKKNRNIQTEENEEKKEIEPKTRIAYPVKLADGKKLMSIGLRRKKVFAINFNVYAFGDRAWILSWYQSTRLLHPFKTVRPMASSSTTTPGGDSATSSCLTAITIPPQLKFFMANVKSMVTVQLTTENHLIWKSQLLKLFTANNFEGYLTGTMVKPDKQLITPDGVCSLNPLYTTWMLTDQHLASAIYSTVSTTLLPYILNLDSSQEIWLTLERRLQSSNRSRLLQLKGELHRLQLGDKTMFQYLSDIKHKIDAIAAAGSTIDAEDIIHYTLNGLPATYQSFKTAIRTQLQPISIDDFYALLCSEELHIQTDQSRESLPTASVDQNFALTATRGSYRGRSNPRGRGRSFPPGRSASGRSSPGRFYPAANQSRGGGRRPRSNIECQICTKMGHSAINCWYRHDASYTASPQAYLATDTAPSADWYLDLEPLNT